ncbi:MAG: ABC transporter permease [Firmicutes bacterium HGW-Firmicutes-15]|nr:MAG: ABC transporter permease [Firmicutes bacterium HGW-Firmicutes-15]
MNSKDLFLMSFKNLLQRKTRTILTVLGVVIGTSSIVIMLSLGIAMDSSFKEDLAQMGSLNIIEVHQGYNGSGMMNKKGPEVKLDDKAVTTFEKIPGVVAVMPLKNANLKMGAGKMVAHVQIMGVRPQDLKEFDFEVEEGRLLQSSDKEAIIFGAQVPYNFRNPRLKNSGGGMIIERGGNMGPGMNQSRPKPQVDLLKSKLIITSDMEYGEKRTATGDPNTTPPKQYEIKGLGILKESRNEKDYQAYMNISQLNQILKEDTNSKSRKEPDEDKQYNNIKVKVKDIENVEGVQKQIKGMGYQTFSLTDMLDSMKKTSRTIQAILAGIGAISLLVAAIGITNTMVMSIYERTREIGIIKVLGANIRDIKKLFLIEAGLIGLGGGLIGLVLSYAVSVILNKVGMQLMGDMGVSRSISIISPELALGAVVFSSLVGLVSGYAPARRAMKLSALDAIRSD